MPEHKSAAAIGDVSGDTPIRSARPLIDVAIEDGDWSALQDIQGLVAETVDALARAEPRFTKNHSATLALSSDAHVAKLNERFRARPDPTNVLSFPSPVPATPGQPDDQPAQPGAPVYLGDIVMAAQTLSREARGLGIPLGDHFRHLLVHGLLHLLGYDHETDQDARNMEAIEINVLKALGVANPYDNARQS